MPPTITPNIIASLRSSILILIAALSHPDCRAINGVLARDIAKSFLRDVPGSQAGAGVAALADEIEVGMLSSGTVVIHSDVSPAKPKGPPSPGYQVFLGNRESYALTIDGEALTLVNEQQEGEAVLRLSLSKDSAAPACAMDKVAY